MSEQQDESPVRIGVIGCGAIGSGIAEALHKRLHPRAILSGAYDIDSSKVDALCSKISNQTINTKTLKDLIAKSDLLVEAVSAPNTEDLIRDVILAGKDILVMSVGKLLENLDLMDLAREKKCTMLIPSGAVSGIDALKAASHLGIDSISLTTYKPPRGLKGAPYIESNGINLDAIVEETVIFEGSVKEAVKAFPQNINVAATIALATQTIDSLKIQIITSPKFQHNRHKITATGSFGTIKTITENFPSPDNPKTSYLAVLSGIASLKNFCGCIKVGT